MFILIISLFKFINLQRPHSVSIIFAFILILTETEGIKETTLC